MSIEKDNTIIFLPYIVYKNIILCLEKYRNLEILSGSLYVESKKSKLKEKYNKDTNQNTEMSSMIDQKTFTKNIQYYGYALIEAKDSNNKDRRFPKTILDQNKNKPVKTYVLLFDTDSIYAQTTQNFIKVLSRIPGFDDKNRNFNMDIIIVSINELNLYIMKKVDSLITEGDENNGYIHIHPYRYYHFTSERPKHKLVAEQRIISKQEEKKVLENLSTEKKYLPKIRKVDAISIWLGCEIGDIIEAKVLSEISGIDTKYLVVRP